MNIIYIYVVFQSIQFSFNNHCFLNFLICIYFFNIESLSKLYKISNKNS